MDLNPPVSACESCAKPCATAYVLIGGIGGNWVSQMDFSAYLSHFQLLIKITALSEVVKGSQGTTKISYVFCAL